MDLFDGKQKNPKPIHLSGSSKPKSKQDLIMQATIERKKREKEKSQQAACLKIQSVFRSFMIRKRICMEFLSDFDKEEKNINSFAFTFRKFLLIQLRSINEPSNTSHSV